ncbi:hypothetical protein GIB67_000371 [Kingdonia uniflora]|uniref:Aminotransferase-like plant mobile domain-containing protein n=1 Tax=Kingdonia uniflora TaxID=39325 RepID=A0A7J7LKU3_9MAGN|nr:hypothetical protein GIB67_000371 [Kingdonia uniflora]
MFTSKEKIKLQYHKPEFSPDEGRVVVRCPKEDIEEGIELWKGTIVGVLLEPLCLSPWMPPRVACKMSTTRGKRLPTASLRKMLNDEREDLSHPNYNNPPRIPAKIVKTCSTRVPVRDSSISGSVPRVSVTPEEDSSQDSSAVESSCSDSQGPRLSRVYPDLKAGGQGISLSLKKIVDFFAGKVGTNAPQAASSSSSPIKLSTRMVGKAYMLYVLGFFLFPTKNGTDVSVKYLSFFQDKDVNKPWSWGAATLVHLYYSLGTSSRVNAKGLACCTTLLESWIFEHFAKLPSIPTPNQSGIAEFCTRWSWTKTTSAQSGSAALNMFREALDSYKLQDVVWDPYLVKREDKHNFNEVASFTGLFYSSEHNEPYYPYRVPRQFNRRQPVPRAPTCVEQSGLRLGVKPFTYKPKYKLVDLFSKEKLRDSIILTRGRKVHDGIPVCTKGYFEWFNSVSFSKLCPDVVNLAEDDTYDDERVEVLHSQNEGGEGPAEVVRDPARSVLVEALAAKTGECASLMEANLRMQADIQAKDVANSICEKILECESKKKMVEDLQIQLADKVKKCETLSSINDKLMEEVYGVWRLALKGAIEGEDFKDTEDPTYEELSRQFTKLLTIAQEGPKGEYEDDIILSGRREYQERIDSRLKKIDHKTNLRQTLFQPFNWFQLNIRDVERDGNTAFRVAASYTYKSQMKFLNVKDSLCTLMTKKPSYWKSIFSQRLDVAHSDLGERRYETLL